MNRARTSELKEVHHVYYVIPRLSVGGLASATLRLSMGLRERGVAVTVVIIHEAPDAELSSKLVGAGVAIVELRMSGRCDRRPLTLIRASRATAKVVGKNPIGAVLDSALAEAAFLGSLVRLLTGMPYVHHVVNDLGREQELSGLLRSIKLAAARRVYRSADAVVAISPICAEAARVTYRLPAAAIAMVPRGIDPLDSADSDLPAGEGRFLCVGRLSPEKGFDLAVQAMASVRQTDARAQLTIVGDGPERTGLEDLADALDLRSCITFVGVVPDARPWIAGSNAVVAPSRREGLGNVVLEAMAQGRVVIASDLPVFAWALDEDALLFRAESAEDLATRMLQVLEMSSQESCERATANRERIASHFRPEFEVEGLLEIYRAAVTRRSLGRRRSASRRRK